MAQIYAPISKIAKTLAEAIKNHRSIDLVEVDGVCYEFDATVEETAETAYTGVEYMGARETYLQFSYDVALSFVGAYDNEDEDVAVELNAAELAAAVESFSDSDDRINVRLD